MDNYLPGQVTTAPTITHQNERKNNGTKSLIASDYMDICIPHALKFINLFIDGDQGDAAQL